MGRARARSTPPIHASPPSRFWDVRSRSKADSHGRTVRDRDQPRSNGDRRRQHDAERRTQWPRGLPEQLCACRQQQHSAESVAWGAGAGERVRPLRRHADWRQSPTAERRRNQPAHLVVVRIFSKAIAVAFLNLEAAGPVVQFAVITAISNGDELGLTAGQRAAACQLLPARHQCC